MPPLGREYLSSEVNALTKNPKILRIARRDFFNPNCFHRDQEIWQRCCRSDFNSVSSRFSCYLSNNPLKGDFLDIYLTTFFGVHNSKNIFAMRVIFFLKMFKIQSKFRKCWKNWEKVFRFWDKWIWKCCSKLPLLRREYLSSAVNGLTNSPKILHITQWDFLSPSYLHRDQ